MKFGKSKRWPLVLFFSLFVMVGLVFLNGFVVKPLHGYWRTRLGVTVLADVIHVHEQYTSTSRRMRHRVHATLRYRYDGKQYDCDRLALFRTASRLAGMLKAAHERHQQVNLFVDPATPSYAVLDREFAWWPFIAGAALAAGFIGAGGYGILCSCRRPN